MNKKAQSSLEFILLVGAMLFFFLSLTYTFQHNIGQRAKNKRTLALQDVAIIVQNEIDLAATASDGYERPFFLPDKIINVDYNITIAESFIYIRSNDGKIAIALPIQNVTGNIQKGDNIIRKINDTVYLN